MCYLEIRLQHKKGKTNLQQCNEDLVSIEGAVKQDQLLQEAFVCGKPGKMN